MQKTLRFPLIGSAEGGPFLNISQGDGAGPVT
jgi:hypothetical protein